MLFFRFYSLTIILSILFFSSPLLAMNSQNNPSDSNIEEELNQQIEGLGKLNLNDIPQELKSNKKRPHFVINCIYYVSDDEEPISPGSPKDDTFSEIDFVDPPFEYIPDNKNIPTIEACPSPRPNNSQKGVNSFLNILTERAFKEEKDSRLNTLSISFLLNRPRSISRSRNRLLVENLIAKEENKRIPFKKIGILWERGSWQLKKNKRWGKTRKDI